MTLRFMLAALVMAAFAVPAHAETAKPVPCDLTADRGICLFNGKSTGGLRLVQKGRRKMYLQSLRAESSVSGLDVTVVDERGNVIALKAGELQRRTSVEVYTGEPSPKSPVKVGLKLEAAGGGAVCSGEAVFDLANGPYDVPFIASKTNCEVVRSVQAYPTKDPGTWAFAFVAIGEGAAKIAGGTITTSTIGKDGKAITSKTPIDAQEITSEREFAAEVRFDGDPVGASIPLEVLVTKDGTPVERVKTTLDVWEVPGCDGGTTVVGVAARNHVPQSDRYMSLSRNVSLWAAP